jgi:hypothetical protein
MDPPEWGPEFDDEEGVDDPQPARAIAVAAAAMTDDTRKADSRRVVRLRDI